jgi:hypothetical protein
VNRSVVFFFFGEFCHPWTLPPNSAIRQPLWIRAVYVENVGHTHSILFGHHICLCVSGPSLLCRKLSSEKIPLQEDTLVVFSLIDIVSM